MENGKWKMENGKWKMENGKWKMENGKWKIFCFLPSLCVKKSPVVPCGLRAKLFL